MIGPQSQFTIYSKINIFGTMGVLLITIVTALASLSSFLSSTGKMADNRSRGIKSLTKRGRITVGLNVALVVVSIMQYFVNKHESDIKEAENHRSQAVRDSILKHQYDSTLTELKRKFDTTNINTITAFTGTLARYGLRADSANNRIVRIVRDSSKTRVQTLATPILSLCPGMGIVFDKTVYSLGRYAVDRYAISFCSLDASSTNYDIKCYIILGDSTSEELHDGIITTFLIPKNMIPKDNMNTYFFGLSRQSGLSYKTI